MSAWTEEELAELEAARAEALTEARAEPKLAVDHVEDLEVAGAAGAVPSRLYAQEGARDVLLYLHGGGFAMGDLTTHDGFARRLALRTGWVVLLPDYRRAPEHAWPAADQDAGAAADWLAAQGFDRSVIIGDSAGSALAIGEALRHPERYVGQVQVYPFIDPSGASYDRGLPDAELSLDRCDLFWRLYLQGAHPSDDPALSVLDRADDLAGQPPTLVQLAELDVLTPAGVRYAQLLADHGVPVRTVTYPGVPHGFWRHTDNDQAPRALDDVASFLADLR